MNEENDMTDEEKWAIYDNPSTWEEAQRMREIAERYLERIRSVEETDTE